jgi:glycosyltransferase involved in cell wall biosynthesis
MVKRMAEKHPDTIRYIFQDRNQGKGAAIRRGIAEMTGELVIFQDADLEYDPNEYSQLLEPIIGGHADVVYGVKIFSSQNATGFQLSSCTWQQGAHPPV